MELGSIEREIFVNASPEIVFDVISSPDHIREWWNGAETNLCPTPGTTGKIAWNSDGAEPHMEAFTVERALYPRVFAFRWVYDDEGASTPVSSLLVTFELEPSGEGTTLRLTETGFREKDWDLAVLEEAYADHARGWDIFVPNIAAYVERLASQK